MLIKMLRQCGYLEFDSEIQLASGLKLHKLCYMNLQDNNMYHLTDALLL